MRFDYSPLLVCLIAFGIGCREMPKKSTESAAEGGMLGAAANASVTLQWLKGLESGNTNAVVRQMRSYLIVQEMFLEAWLRDFPEATNSVRASNVLQQVRTYFGRTNSGVGTMLPQLPNDIEELSNDRHF